MKQLASNGRGELPPAIQMEKWSYGGPERGTRDACCFEPCSLLVAGSINSLPVRVQYSMNGTEGRVSSSLLSVSFLFRCPRESHKYLDSMMPSPTKSVDPWRRGDHGNLEAYGTSTVVGVPLSYSIMVRCDK